MSAFDPDRSASSGAVRARPASADLRRPISMERLLVWAMKDQMADHVMSHTLRASPDDYAAGVAADGCFAVARRQVLGTQVDCAGSAASASPHLHPDAELVWLRCWELLDAATFRLVIDCAKNDTRPDWRPDMPAFEVHPVTAPKQIAGRWHEVVRIFESPKTKARYCCIEFEDRRAERDAFRGVYSYWQRALARLASQFKAEPERLSRWFVIETGIPAKPWADD